MTVFDSCLERDENIWKVDMRPDFNENSIDLKHILNKFSINLLKVFNV